MFTHCGIGLGSTSLANTIAKLQAKNLSLKSNTTAPSTSPQKAVATDSTSNADWIPFSNSSKLSFVCLGTANDSYYQQALKLYQEFLDTSKQKGQLFTPSVDNNKSNNSNDESGKAEKIVLSDTTSSNLPTIAEWKNEIIPNLIEKMCEINYKPFEAILKCGGYHKLDASIVIWPTPMVRLIDYFSF